MSSLPNAEDMRYWKTGRTSPDGWIEKTKKVVNELGGVVLGEAFGNEPLTGRSAYMLQFRIGNDTFKVIWPVLPSRDGSEQAARIQAATMLYHDTKAKCVKAAVFGARVAFFEYLLLPDGRNVTEVGLPDLAESIPRLPPPQVVGLLEHDG